MDNAITIGKSNWHDFEFNFAVQDFLFGRGEGDVVCHADDCCLVSGS
jgi:hypothetical protein